MPCTRRSSSAWNATEHGGEAEYLPDESRAIRHLFIRYMGYRKDLLHLARVYIGFKKVQGDALRDRCFLVGYGAAAGVGSGVDLRGEISR